MAGKPTPVAVTGGSGPAPGGDRPPVTAPSGAGARVRLVRDYAIVVSFVALFIALTLSSDVFLTSTNLLNVLEQNAPVGIIAIALTYVLIAGEFDLSAGAIYVLTGVLAAKWAEPLGAWPAIIAAVAAGLGMGLVNGLIVAYARVDSFVCTLATSLIVAGASLAITKGFITTVPDKTFSQLGDNELLGVKLSIWIFGLVAVIFGVILARSKFGRWLFAVGGNPEAARLSGINLRGIRVTAFMVSGFAAGLAGVIVASRTGQGQSGDGLSIVLFAFAAVVVGGTSVLGGRGAIWRTVLGVLLLALITNGFNLLSVDPIYQQIVQGVIILLAVSADALSRRMST